MFGQKICFFLLVLGSIDFATSVEVQSCSNNAPKPIAVDINGCTNEPCDLVDGTDAILNVTFLVPSNSETLKPKVRAFLGSLAVPYILPSDKQNGCDWLINGYCPIDKGEVLLYQLQMPISNYPKISLTIELSLLGDKNVVMSCFKVACNVVGVPGGLRLTME